MRMASAKPTVLGELQLYKVLQRANLLSYYEAFISQGGDDVQQLCEAGEDEFLEIMALVGMASKPLHVRRLQKALQEWVTRPSLFRGTNIHYLPAQSVSLTSLGIDTRDLILPPQNSLRSSTSPNFSRESVVQESINGSAASTPRSSNVFVLNDNQRKTNGSTNKTDIKLKDTSRTAVSTASTVLNEIVQKHVMPAASLLEKQDVIVRLKADQSLRDFALAIESDNGPRLELLIRDFLKSSRIQDGGTTSHREALVVDAAVKLCMADERWLLKKSDLMASAEKIASEAELKLSSQRRSSTHLHGSCSQSRIQELDESLQNVKVQRSNLMKKLAEAQANKNVIKENECQNVLARITKDEAILLQEKTELTGKLQSENKDLAPNAISMESSFSSELADLAKAHNLSFGNLQSMPSTSRWSPREVGSNFPNGTNGVGNAAESGEPVARHRVGGQSPSSSMSGSDLPTLKPEIHSEIPVIKKEGATGGEDSAFPSAAGASIRASKRKLSSGSCSDNSNGSKRFVTTADRDTE